MPNYRHDTTSVTYEQAWEVVLAHANTIRSLIQAAVRRGNIARADFEDTYNSALAHAVELARTGVSDNFEHHLVANLSLQLHHPRAGVDALDHTDHAELEPDQHVAPPTPPSPDIPTTPPVAIPARYTRIFAMLREGRTVDYIAKHTGRKKSTLLQVISRYQGEQKETF